MTVDEILALGRYTDRRGREWDYFDTRVDYDRWQRWESRGEEDLILDTDEMRLLIVRDKHRVGCKGLLGCRTHPVPVVTIQYNEDGLIIYETDYTRRTYPTLPEAMDAARALAVGE